jgi:hypothetical protein
MNIKIDDSISESWGLCQLNIRLKLYSLAIAWVIGWLISNNGQPLSLWAKFYMLLIFFYDREIIKHYLAPKSLMPILIFSIAVLSWFVYIFMEMRKMLTIVYFWEMFLIIAVGIAACYRKRQNKQELFIVFLVIMLASILCMTPFGVVLLGIYCLLYFCKKWSMKRHVVKTKKDFEKFCDEVPKIGCIFILESAAILMPVISSCKANNVPRFISNSIFMFCTSLWVFLDSEIYLKWTKNQITSIEAEE